MWLGKRFSIQNRFTNNRKIIIGYDTLRENTEIRRHGPSTGRDSSVGTATRYGMDVPGFESRLGDEFSASVQTGPGAHRVCFPEVKRQERRLDRPPPYSAEVKAKVEL